MQRTFQKIKITAANKVEVTYKTTDEENGSFTANEEHSAKPHQDFINAMQTLAIHFAIVSEYLQSKAIKNLQTERENSKEVEKFTVRGFTLGVDDAEDIWIIISGNRKMSSGKAQNFNSVKVDFETEGESEYKFVADLLDCVGNVKIECTAYLGGKCAPEVQQSLAFEEETK